MTESTDLLVRLFKKENIFVILCISILIILSWLYIFNISSMKAPGTMDSKLNNIVMPQMEKWTLNDILTTFAMWSVMMIAMMLPSAMPMILVFSAVNKKRHSFGNQFVPTSIFVFGYIIVWVVFSFVAALTQLIIHNFALLSPDIRIINPVLSGIILISAGIYQFTPVKEICLKNCQSPLSFMMGYWRDGKVGAFIMGLHHGLYCAGCCWILMILLFVAGVMNLLWISLIAVFIFLEKVIQRNHLLSYIAGFLLIVWGFSLIAL